MRAGVSEKIQVKAAGGVLDLDGLIRVRDHGATRCGATATAAMLDEYLLVKPFPEPPNTGSVGDRNLSIVVLNSKFKEMKTSTLLTGLSSILFTFFAVLAIQVSNIPKTFIERLSDLEKVHGGRLGVAALNTADGKRLDYRSDERFAMCSTFKWILVAAILNRVDHQKESLSRRVPYSKEDLLSYAPITQAHVREGAMTVEALCAATIAHSDNTAANLLLGILGGPQAFTAYLRSLGDTVTRLDRNEPTLNSNQPGDGRDTTTPRAMLETMQKILGGQVLSPASRKRLEGYLLANTTGGKRLRAGIPALWRLGDKTGSGMNGAFNDIAIVWPTGRPPILIAAYYSESAAAASVLETVLAEVGALVSQELVVREEFTIRQK